MALKQQTANLPLKLTCGLMPDGEISPVLNESDLISLLSNEIKSNCIDQGHARIITCCLTGASQGA